MSLLKKKPAVASVKFSVPIELSNRLRAVEEKASELGITVDLDSVLAKTLLKEILVAEKELGIAGASARGGAQAPTGFAANAATQA